MNNQKQNLFAVILDNSDSYNEYLHELSNSVGFRYVLASHLEVFLRLIELELPTSLFIIRFERYLNHQLRAYLDIIRNSVYEDVPVLFICSDQTTTQVSKVIERKIDSYIVAPFDTEEFTAKTGTLLRRGLRSKMELRIWLELDQRIIYGKTLDVSASGMSIQIPDPILVPRFQVRVFLPDAQRGDLEQSVQFEIQVRRKERQPEGGYILGAQILRVLGGKVSELGRHCGVVFRELSDGEAGVAGLVTNMAAAPVRSEPDS